jgi:hypothetical protein
MKIDTLRGSTHHENQFTKINFTKIYARDQIHTEPLKKVNFAQIQESNHQDPPRSTINP